MAKLEPIRVRLIAGMITLDTTDGGFVSAARIESIRVLGDGAIEARMVSGQRHLLAGPMDDVRRALAPVWDCGGDAPDLETRSMVAGRGGPFGAGDTMSTCPDCRMSQHVCVCNRWP